MLKIVEKKKIWFSISAIIILIGIGFMAFKGLNLGIDFAGGTSVTFEFGGDFNKVEVDEMVKEYAKDPVTNTVNDTQYEVKSKDFPNDKVTEFVKASKEKYDTMPEEDSKLINHSLITLNEATANVKQASEKISKESDSILSEVRNLENSEENIRTRMNEMAIGAEKISEIGNALAQLSENVEKSIKSISSQIDSFNC